MIRALQISWRSLLYSDAPPHSARYLRVLLAIYAVLLACVVTVVFLPPTFNPWQLEGVALLSALLLQHIVFAFPWPASPVRVVFRAVIAVWVSLVFLALLVANVIRFVHHLSPGA